jgi:UDP-N-acetylglucosamine 2-epimerase (non-hydrolysing)
MRITLIAGARPNFMKIAPIIHAIKKQTTKDQRQISKINRKKPKQCEDSEKQKKQKKDNSIEYRLVHTGQHYDRNMSDTFFKELNILEPDVNLGCGGGTQAEQTAAIMIAFEKELQSNPADLVLVVGDVTSTMACSIVAKKLNTRVAHVEAGIRSYDITMPEEINRMVTDTLTDYFFTTTELAGNNLRKNGVPDGKIYFVGNVMIDTLRANQHRFKKPKIWNNVGLKGGNYIVVTLHRPNNVDNGTHLKSLLEAITSSSHGIPIIFPVHPRTANNIRSFNFPVLKSLNLIEPLSYLEFNYLVEHSKAVITDSGGITEETTVMGVPCITIRDTTESPETIDVGTNELIGTDPSSIQASGNLVAYRNCGMGRQPQELFKSFWH